MDRYIPFLNSLIILIAWEAMIFLPRYFLVCLLFIAPFYIISLLKFNKFKIKNKDFWLLILPGLCLIVFTTIFLLFLNYHWSQHLLAFFIAGINYFFVLYIYLFLCRIAGYAPLSLEKSSSYFNIISYLFLGISAYGLINLLNFKLWILAVIAVFITWLLTYQFFWINKIEEKQNHFAAIIITVLMIEFFWAISLLPISHFISGLALAIIYYVIINIFTLHFLEKLNNKIIKQYLALGLICIFAILLSARWL